jgi:ABC-type nickel/cobalt efflux system permease component RcnA
MFTKQANTPISKCVCVVCVVCVCVCVCVCVLWSIWRGSLKKQPPPSKTNAHQRETQKHNKNQQHFHHKTNNVYTETSKITPPCKTNEKHHQKQHSKNNETNSSFMFVCFFSDLLSLSEMLNCCVLYCCLYCPLRLG